jgi:cell pole-organizing protein PopZ
MSAAPGQNATVEEILASIRQAISEDDAKRTNERMRGEPRASAEKKPAGSVSNVLSQRNEPKPKAEPEFIAPDGAMSADDLEASADQEFIEQAIEQALDGVRAELESARAAVAKSARVSMSTPDVAATAAVAGSRTVPRASRGPAPRREAAPQIRRTLMSPGSGASVAASFEDLAKAMMGGSSQKLDEVVEELLRPMLKNWLESNLPQMVERLVREEIERVSRGSR